MRRLREMSERLARLDSELRGGGVVRSAVAANEAYIADMNAEDQLYGRGVNRLGVRISDYMPYSPVTVEIKRMKGQPYDRVTLRDTGEFHRSFCVSAGADSFSVSATDGKTAGLVRKYGRQIFGLTRENVSELLESYLYPDIMDSARRKLFRDV